MKNVRVARRYAKGLLSVAEEQKVVEQTVKDLDLIAQIHRDSREFRMLVASPVVSAQKKAQIFKDLLGPHISKPTMLFVSLMTAKNREALLPDVVEEFHALRDEMMGLVTVEVTSAVEFTPTQEVSLKSQLESYTQKKVRVKFSLDNAIKGGLVVKIGDTVLDASVRRQLELLRERLVLGSPLAN